jgi:hypothetical protein
VGVGSNPTSDIMFFTPHFVAWPNISSYYQCLVLCPTKGTPSGYSRVAQWKRAGPITQRSVDRNHALLEFLFHNFHQIPFTTVYKQTPTPVVRWCSGYHICFTRRRSPVRPWHGSVSFVQFYAGTLQHVRMAEWSKAPDSRLKPCPLIGDERRFLVLL